MVAVGQAWCMMGSRNNTRSPSHEYQLLCMTCSCAVSAELYLQLSLALGGCRTAGTGRIILFLPWQWRQAKVTYLNTQLLVGASEVSLQLQLQVLQDPGVQLLQAGQRGRNPLWSCAGLLHQKSQKLHASLRLMPEDMKGCTLLLHEEGSGHERRQLSCYFDRTLCSKNCYLPYKDTLMALHAACRAAVTNHTGTTPVQWLQFVLMLLQRVFLQMLAWRWCVQGLWLQQDWGPFLHSRPAPACQSQHRMLAQLPPHRLQLGWHHLQDSNKAFGKALVKAQQVALGTQAFAAVRMGR